jgi:adenylate cyclase
VFELLGKCGSCPQRLRDLAERYEAGLAACGAQDLAGARAAFEAALEVSPSDGPSRAMLARLDRPDDEPFVSNGIGP